MKFSDHVSHEWQQVGPCVYCSCGPRLYQGKLVKDKAATAAAMDAITEAHEKKAAERDRKEWAERTPEQERAYGEGREAFRDDFSVVDRLGLNPYTPKKTGKPLGHPDTQLMRWWSWGWDDVEFECPDRRKAIS